MTDPRRRPMILDMTKDGDFVGAPPSRAPAWLVRAGLAAALVAVVCAAIVVAALLLWLALWVGAVATAVALVASLVAWATVRLQAWRGRGARRVVRTSAGWPP